MNKFEQDLKDYFPEIYELHTKVKNRKENWEALIQISELLEHDRLAAQVVEKLWQQYKRGAYGEMQIVYQKGKVNKLYRREVIEITSPK